MTKFSAILKEHYERDLKTMSRIEIARALNLTSANSIPSVINNGSTSKETYAAMCKRWPRLVGTLDPDLLKTDGKKARNKKCKLGNEPLLPKVAAPTSELSEFEIGLLLVRLARQPGAVSWIESLEAACRKGVPFQQVVTALKTSQKEVTHG